MQRWGFAFVLSPRVRTTVLQRAVIPIVLFAALFEATLVGNVYAVCPARIEGAGTLLLGVLANPGSPQARADLANLYEMVGGCEGVASFYLMTVDVLEQRNRLERRLRDAGEPCVCDTALPSVPDMPLLRDRRQVLNWIEAELGRAKERLIGRRFSCGELLAVASLGRAWLHLGGGLDPQAGDLLELVIRSQLLLAFLPDSCATGRNSRDRLIGAAELLSLLGDHVSAATACGVAISGQGAGLDDRVSEAIRRGWVEFCVAELWKAQRYRP